MSKCSRPNVVTTPAGTFRRSAAVGFDSPASPIADTVSGETSTSTGMTSWNASVSPASLTVILTRARPVDRPAASKRTSTEPPAGTSTVCGAVDRRRGGGGHKWEEGGVGVVDGDGRGSGRLQLTGHARAERGLVAARQEPRERGLQRDGLVDPDLAVGGSEP